MSWLGVFALLLAGIGLHALIAYHVTQRSSEFGVRMVYATEENPLGTA